MNPRYILLGVLALLSVNFIFLQRSYTLSQRITVLETRLAAVEMSRAIERRERSKEKETQKEPAVVEQGSRARSKGKYPKGPEESVGPESNTRIPKRGGKVMDVEGRMTLLEKKFGGMLNWVRYPHKWVEIDYRCKNTTYLETPTEPGVDHAICLDNWEHYASGERECIIYDLGVRSQPEFGVRLAKMGCKVFAFDPSPVTRDSAADLGLLNMTNYNISFIGAGGVDGDTSLFEYNWGQVSIIRYPVHFQENRTKMVIPDQKTFSLPVLTLPTMMQMHGHTGKELTILKIDIEGSEYTFLEQIFDEFGCPPAEQISIEWHHYDIDSRYGSSPELMVLGNLFRDCGFRQFAAHDWIFEDKSIFGDDPKTPRFRYQLSSWCKRCDS